MKEQFLWLSNKKGHFGRKWRPTKVTYDRVEVFSLLSHHRVMQGRMKGLTRACMYKKQSWLFNWSSRGHLSPTGNRFRGRFDDNDYQARGMPQNRIKNPPTSNGTRIYGLAEHNSGLEGKLFYEAKRLQMWEKHIWLMNYNFKSDG